MNFTKSQTTLLVIGILTLVNGFGLGSHVFFLGLGFGIICVALCYRNWWSDEINLTE